MTVKKLRAIFILTVVSFIAFGSAFASAGTRTIHNPELVLGINRVLRYFCLPKIYPSVKKTAKGYSDG